MNHSPVEVLRAALIEGLCGTSPSQTPGGAWPIFVSHLPETPDNAICVYDTAGVKDGRLMSGETIKHPGFQVRVRATGYANGFAQIEQIAIYLDTLHQEAVVVDGDSYRIVAVTQTSGPVSIGQEPDGKRREGLTLNGTITVQST